MPGFTVTVSTFDHTRDVMLAVERNMRQAVDDTAHDIQTTASQRAPRDTGSLAASIYVNNGEESDYVERTADAQARNKEVVILEEVDPEFAISLSGGTDASYVSVVGVAAGHGIFQEFGTRFQPPQPFMFGAIEVARDEFTTRMSHVADTV